MKRRVSWFSIVLLGILAGCTIVPIEEMAQIQQSETFDPVTYVDGIWENQVVPTIQGFD